MEGTSSEHALFPDEVQGLIEHGVRSMDLTLIYNAHGTVEDANVSTSYVELDSVAFLEGYTTRKGGQGYYESDLQALNAIRIGEGKDSPAYSQLKQAILDNIESHADYQPASPYDYTLNCLATIKALLNKDCLIFYADRREILAVSEDDTLAAELNQTFLANEQYIAEADLPYIAPTEGVAPAIRYLKRSTIGDLYSNAVREGHAAIRSLMQIGVITETSQPDIRKTADGKIAGYMLYGTAHAHSLTWQFTSRDMEPRVVEVNPLPEHSYIDVVMAPDYNNAGRRLGHTALKSLAYDFFDREWAEAITTTTYHHLEFLNEASREEMMQFLMTCALIKRQESRDREDACLRYLSTLRSLMRSPQNLLPE